MKPSVITNANASAGGNSAAPSQSSNGITIPINHDYGQQYQHHPQQQQQQQPHPHQHHQTPPQQQQYPYGYGSPSSGYHQTSQYPQTHPGAAASSSQPQSASSHESQFPGHFQQGFGFDPNIDMDMDMDMFPRTARSRMHDPFAGFGSSHFGFPQFGSMGRRRGVGVSSGVGADPSDDDDNDFFNRLPSQFRQYIPEGFGTSHRRAAGGPHAQQSQHQMPQHSAAAGGAGPGAYYTNYMPASGVMPPNATQSSASLHNNNNNNSGTGMPPQSAANKKLCDAAIQTEDPAERSEVDYQHVAPAENLKQHGLRNTVDMGVKMSAAGDNELHGSRSHSAPPPPNEQQQQQMYMNGQQGAHQPQTYQQQRPTPPPQGGGMHQHAFGTQTSPQVGMAGPQQFHPHPKTPAGSQYYPQQQKQQTPPPAPQTPGGTYVRTIPIFVEGRSEPIINAHKEIPNQNAAPPQSQPRGQAYAGQQSQPQQQFYPQQQQQQQQQQQHRPTPFNTQQQPQQQQQPQPQSGGPSGSSGAGADAGVPPQTPHTMDSINKIQDIQRDVLDLMSKVENFTGTRKDKEYVYLDEMLTRNLLKLDTIDTNGKDSIRLARKEAIKCIQASINVLEAKAEDNAKRATASEANSQQQQQQQPHAEDPQAGEAAPQTETSQEPNATEAAAPVKATSSSSSVKSNKETANETAAGQDENAPTDATKKQEAIPLPPPEGMTGGEQPAAVTSSGSKTNVAAVESGTAAGAADESDKAATSSATSTATASESK